MKIFRARPEYRKIIKMLGTNEIAILIPIRLYQVVVNDVFIYEYNRLEELAHVFLRFISVGIRDPLLLGRLMGGLNEDVIKEIAGSLEKQGLIKSEKLEISKLKEYYSGIAIKDIIPKDIIDDLIANITYGEYTDELEIYSLTDNGLYALEKNLVRFLVPAKYVEFIVEPTSKLIVDFGYSLRNLPLRSCSQENISEELSKIGFDIINIIKDSGLREEWQVPENIAEPMDSAKVYCVSNEDYYYAIILGSDRKIKTIELVPKDKTPGKNLRRGYNPFRKERRMRIRERLRELMKKPLKKALVTIENSFNSQKQSEIENDILIQIEIFDEKINVPISDESIESIIEDDFSIMIESILSDGAAIQIDFQDFIVLVKGYFLTSNKDIAKKSLAEYLSKKIRDYSGEFIDSDFWKERKKDYEKVKIYWGKYLPDVLNVWNTVIELLPKYFWEHGEYLYTYKLRMKNDLNLDFEV